jgi:hypothetical protein
LQFAFLLSVGRRAARYGLINKTIDQITKAATAIFQQSLRFFRPGYPSGLMICTNIAKSKKRPIAFVIA